jgi:hypothetical protein
MKEQNINLTIKPFGPRNGEYYIIYRINNHYSIDTYAKKLFLTKETEEYNKLKHLLNLYLIFEQTKSKYLLDFLGFKYSELFYSGFVSDPTFEEDFKNYNKTNLDHRYDVFLASILQNDLSCPENIKIVTYNYDNQFEIASSYYSRSINKDSGKGEVGIVGLPDKICKLNGAAGPFSSEGILETNDIKPTPLAFCKAFKLLHNVVDSHDDKNRMSDISFAWESNREKNIIDKAKIIMQSTDNLVIIGYSFPEFNRELDELLFPFVNNNARVFVQVDSRDFELVLSRLKLRRRNKGNNKIEQVKYLDQFYIP